MSKAFLRIISLICLSAASLVLVALPASATIKLGPCSFSHSQYTDKTGTCEGRKAARTGTVYNHPVFTTYEDVVVPVGTIYFHETIPYRRYVCGRLTCARIPL